MTNLADTHPLVVAVRKRMEDEDLTQRQVAEQIGVSVRAVQNWMYGDTTPQKRYRQAIRTWLNGDVV